MRRECYRTNLRPNKTVGQKTVVDEKSAVSLTEDMKHKGAKGRHKERTLAWDKCTNEWKGWTTDEGRKHQSQERRGKPPLIMTTNRTNPIDNIPPRLSLASCIIIEMKSNEEHTVGKLQAWCIYWDCAKPGCSLYIYEKRGAHQNT